jgi:hypothetical protein
MVLEAREFSEEKFQEGDGELQIFLVFAEKVASENPPDIRGIFLETSAKR